MKKSHSQAHIERKAIRFVGKEEIKRPSRNKVDMGSTNLSRFANTKAKLETTIEDWVRVNVQNMSPEAIFN